MGPRTEKCPGSRWLSRVNVCKKAVHVQDLSEENKGNFRGHARTQLPEVERVQLQFSVQLYDHESDIAVGKKLT